MPHGLAAKVLQIAPFFLERVHESQCSVSRACSDGFHQFVQRVFRHNAKKFTRRFVFNLVAAVCARLLEKRQCIAQTSFRHSRDYAHRAIINFQILFAGNIANAPGNFIEGQRAKMKMLRTRPDRIHQIFRLRRRHHKNHAVGRLFQSLQ